MNNQNGRPMAVKIMQVIFLAYVAITFILAMVGFKSKRIDLAFESDNISEWTDDWQIFVDRDEIDATSIPVKINGVTSETVVIKNKLPAFMEGKLSQEDRICLLLLIMHTERACHMQP